MMICGGISVKGSYHGINQDWYSTFSDDTVSVIVVSDGVGSKKKSHIGAEKICTVVVEETLKCSVKEICSEEFLERIQNKWHESIGDEEINLYCCTLMFCIVKEGKAFLAQLGDGIAGMYHNGDTIVFYDDNEQHYINETDCLSASIDTVNWRTMCIELNGKFGALLCTDGIGISPDDISGYTQFVREFVSEYSNMCKSDIVCDIENWLSEWSGADDKTLAFMLMEEDE